MGKITNTKVADVFDNYPAHIQHKLLYLRQLILETASENDEVSDVEESLKWGEPSYVSKKGSPIRVGWKTGKPHEYSMYFNCQTKLVDTFRELHSDKFRFEGNRQMVFSEDTDLPVEELKQCILLALTYHDRKHLSLLGA